MRLPERETLAHDRSEELVKVDVTLVQFLAFRQSTSPSSSKSLVIALRTQLRRAASSGAMGICTGLTSKPGEVRHDKVQFITFQSPSSPSSSKSLVITLEHRIALRIAQREMNCTGLTQEHREFRPNLVPFIAFPRSISSSSSKSLANALREPYCAPHLLVRDAFAQD